MPDPNILTNSRINTLEAQLLFSGTNADPDDVSFMHNDFSDSNSIVDDDRIVALDDGKMAGFFGWRLAGAVHRRIRMP